jgi:TP901 family phage tail tape measure protein
MANVGYATLRIIPSFDGFGSGLGRQVVPGLAGAGTRAGQGFGRSMMGGLAPIMKTMGLTMGAVAVGGFVKSAINVEKEFSQTMNVMAAVAQVPQDQLKELGSLAKKMGADTVFSANEAAEAMLELAKAGISTSQITGGALAGTLTLAAAGGVGLAEAATVASNSLNAFGLDASKTEAVAAALAGGANASSASIQSLAYGLSQVSAGARSAGLTINDTVGVLALLDSNGIKGSDAGTSLKVMLGRLVPQTKKAAGQMKALGLDFTDAQGNFVSIAEVADQLNRSLSRLSESKKKTALKQMFGEDAERAASILTRVGGAGIREYIAATEDLGAAQRVADARMAGTAGAMEQLSGSWETLKLAMAENFFSPVLVPTLNAITGAINVITPALDNLDKYLGPVRKQLSGVAGEGSAWTKTFGAVGTFISALLPPLREVGGKVLSVLLSGFRSLAKAWEENLLPAIQALLPVVTPLAKFLVKFLGSAIVGALKGAFQALSGFVKIVSGVVKVITALIGGDFGGVWDGLVLIVKGALEGIVGLVKVWWNLGILSLFRKMGAFLTKGLWKKMWSGITKEGTRGLTGILGALAKGLWKMTKVFAKTTFGIVRFFVRLPKNILSALRGAGTWLVGTGKSLISGLLKGIKPYLGNIAATILSAIPGPIRRFFGLDGSTPGTLPNVAAPTRTASENTSLMASQVPQKALNITVQSTGKLSSDLREVEYTARRYTRGGSYGRRGRY